MLCVTGGDNMDSTFQSSVTIHTGFTNLTDLQLISDSSTRKRLQHYINMFSNFSTLRNNLFVWGFFLFLWLLLQETLKISIFNLLLYFSSQRTPGEREEGSQGPATIWRFISNSRVVVSTERTDEYLTERFHFLPPFICI